MVKLFQVGHEHVVDETERVYRMQISEIITSVELLDISLWGVEEHALQEGRCPEHLHLYDKLSSAVILAPDIYYGIFLHRGIRGQLCRQKFQIFNFLTLLERQKGVEETLCEFLVLAKDSFEGEVGARIQIFHCSHIFIGLLAQISRKYFNYPSIFLETYGLPDILSWDKKIVPHTVRDYSFMMSKLYL